MVTTWVRFLSKFLLNDFAGILKEHGLTMKTNPIPPELAGFIIYSIYTEDITRATGRLAIGKLLK